MDTSQSFLNHQVPYVHRFEYVAEQTSYNGRCVEYVDPYLSLVRCSNQSDGSMRNSRIVAIRLSRIDELAKHLVSVSPHMAQTVNFSELVAVAHALAQPRFRHVAIYSDVEEMVAGDRDRQVDPSAWAPFLGALIGELPPPLDEDIEPLMATEEPPQQKLMQSSQPSIPDAAKPSGKPPSPRRQYPSQP